MPLRIGQATIDAVGCESIADMTPDEGPAVAGEEARKSGDREEEREQANRRSRSRLLRLRLILFGFVTAIAMATLLVSKAMDRGSVESTALALALSLVAGTVMAATAQLQREKATAQLEATVNFRDVANNLAAAVSASPGLGGAGEAALRRALAAARRGPERASEAVAELDPVAGARLQMIAKLRSRARTNRYFSLVSIAGMAGAILLAFMLFSRVDDLVATLSGVANHRNEDAGPDERPDAAAVAAVHLTSRVGLILLIIFAVQILHGVFRYMQRIAAFYDARADALELAAGNQEFTAIVSTLTPDVEFGNAPKTPTEHITKLVSDAMERIRRDEPR